MGRACPPGHLRAPLRVTGAEGFPIHVSSPAQPRAHRRLSLALLVVASLLAFLAVFAVWANRQLLDTDNWTDSSTKLLENDAIRTQLSIFLVDQLYANVDVQGQLAGALPPRLAPLAGPAAGGLKEVAQRGAAELLERPRVQSLWEQANRRAHKRLLDVLYDRGSAVSTSNGNVTLNLATILGQTERLGGLSKKLPPSAAQLTILRSDQLKFAQDVARYLRALALVLVVLSLGLFALAVYLARGWRREALRATGVGLVAAGVVALLAKGLAGNAVVGALATTDSVRPAVDAAWSISTSLLVQAATATIAYGVVIFLAAWLAGPTRAAIATRAALAPWLREARFAYGGLAVIVLLVIAWGPTPATQKVVPVLFMIVLLGVGTEVLRRQAARENPEASREATLHHLRTWLSGLAGRVGSARSTSTGEGDRTAELERLGRLRKEGILDAAEFEREKLRILGNTPAAVG